MKSHGPIMGDYHVGGVANDTIDAVNEAVNDAVNGTKHGVDFAQGKAEPSVNNKKKRRGQKR